VKREATEVPHEPALAEPSRHQAKERVKATRCTPTDPDLTNDARISVSVATIEFAATPEGTALSWTEQGACLDGFDGAEAPRLREGGTAEMLDGLAKYLA
jgi:hypothetical protein